MINSPAPRRLGAPAPCEGCIRTPLRAHFRPAPEEPLFIVCRLQLDLAPAEPPPLHRGSSGAKMRLDFNAINRKLLRSKYL